MKLLILATIVGSAAAFAPSSSDVSTSALRSSLSDNLNGWKPDQNEVSGCPRLLYAMNPINS